MDVSSLFAGALSFVEAHRVWAGPIFALLAFGESMVVVGVLLPATGVMMAAGALVGAGTLPLADLWIGGAVGGALGDTVSYWLGRWLGPGAHRSWPFSRYPEILAVGERVFARWGWVAVFLGRFIGPMRASVPTAAGILAMRHASFQTANIASAILWIPVLVAPGSIMALAWRARESGDDLGAVLLIVALLAIVAAAWLAARRWLPRLLRRD